MPRQRPSNLAVCELGGGNLAGEGAVRLVEDVLAADFDAGGEMFADEKEVEVGRCDDDFCYWREGVV